MQGNKNSHIPYLLNNFLLRFKKGVVKTVQLITFNFFSVEYSSEFYQPLFTTLPKF